MVTALQKLGLATKKLRNLLQIQKIHVMMKLKRLWRKLNYKKKKKLELRLQEFFSLVEELMRTNNGSNEHDLEKEYEELDNVRNTAMVTLMEINSKLEFLNEQLEKEEKLCKEQL